MSIIWRTSALAQRHAEIGGELEDWNGMGTAWFYDHTPERAKADYEAIRTKAGLMDVSGLKKVHVVGEHAAQVIDRVTTRNVEKIMPGRSTYACMLNDQGKFIDDCVIWFSACFVCFRVYRLNHGCFGIVIIDEFPRASRS